MYSKAAIGAVLLLSKGTTSAIEHCVSSDVVTYDFESPFTNDALSSAPFSVEGDSNPWRLDTGAGCGEGEHGDGYHGNHLTGGLDVNGVGSNTTLYIDIPDGATSMSYYYSYPDPSVLADESTYKFSVGSEQYDGFMTPGGASCAEACISLPEGESRIPLKCASTSSDWCSVDQIVFYKTTPSPTLSPTTANPTLSPSKTPTDSPSESPTTDEPTTGAPTPFVPEVVSFTAPPTNSCSIKYAAYFQVKAGDKWTKMTDVAITSYGVREMQVYVKRGEAELYEKTPCAWDLVAETDSSYNPGYWKRNIYPDWKDGFKPVIIAPNETISVYMINVGSSYGFCMKSQWRGEKYTKTWQQLPAESPVGAVSISWGNDAAKHDHFKPGRYYAVGNYGGVKLETVKPGSETHEPTMAPTESSTPGEITKDSVVGSENSYGLQFDVKNKNPDKDLIIKSFGMPLTSSGGIDVWMRDGSHKDTFQSPGSCHDWNNWCGGWTNLIRQVNVNYSSQGLSSSPSFIAVIKPGQTSSFVLASHSPIFDSKSGTVGAANGDLEIDTATPLADYYGNDVQSLHDLTGSLASQEFNIKIDYAIANSVCAVQSMKPWVVLDPDPISGASVSSMGSGSSEADYEEVEVEQIAHFHGDEGELIE